jgi:hypothetical protein
MKDCTYNLGFEVFYDLTGKPKKFRDILKVEK